MSATGNTRLITAAGITLAGDSHGPLRNLLSRMLPRSGVPTAALTTAEALLYFRVLKTEWRRRRLGYMLMRLKL